MKMRCSVLKKVILSLVFFDLFSIALGQQTTPTPANSRLPQSQNENLRPNTFKHSTVENEPILPPLKQLLEQPLSQKISIFDRRGKKIAEIFDQFRVNIKFSQIPRKLIEAFLAAEDEHFYEHKGISPQAILRAFKSNTENNDGLQGGSTITQQLAKNLLGSSEKTFYRKIREALYSYYIEKNLSKNEILEIYLNMIYLGENAYGVEAASQTYFRKSVDKLTVAEMAILAGLPKAPSRDNPAENPARAKQRQLYVLKRMKDSKFITSDQQKNAENESIPIFKRKKNEVLAPYFVDLIKQSLIKKLGDKIFQLGGFDVYTSLDLEKQLSAEVSLKQGLLELDKRQGYHIQPHRFMNENEVQTFLAQNSKLSLLKTDGYILKPDGTIEMTSPKYTDKAAQDLRAILLKPNVISGVVRHVSDVKQEVIIEFPEFIGILSLADMKWARTPDPKVSLKWAEVKKPSHVFAPMVRIDVQVKGWTSPSQNFSSHYSTNMATPKLIRQIARVSLEQDPLAEAALLAFDQDSEEVISMVGGFDFNKSQFNRAVQSRRQAGSIFKTFIASYALEKGTTTNSLLQDTPFVAEDDWSPENHDKKFIGDIPLGVAFLKSLNLPFVKLLNEFGYLNAIHFLRRMGFFNALNPDDTLVLGSSNVTLYETLRAISEITRLGRPMNPILIHKVIGRNKELLMAEYRMDDFFMDFYPYSKPYLENDRRGIKPTTADLMTRLLKLATKDKEGTGLRASALGLPIAGKTGTSNDYFDAWFVGTSSYISTIVWTGFDEERSLGIGETGSRAPLSIWLKYMAEAHKGLPKRDFEKSPQVINVAVDRKTGLLPQSKSDDTIQLPFLIGTEPKATFDLKQANREDLKDN
jgi:penicillin-binding protein 1A